MTNPILVLCLTWACLGKMAHATETKSLLHIQQQSDFVSAYVGDKVTLRCFCEGDASRLYWYKQALGQKPKLISTFYKYEKNATFYDEFKNNPRFTLDTGISKVHLMITDLRVSDSATYYCASSFAFFFEFAQGVTVNVKGSGVNIKAWVHQSASETIQPGGSVTLNCTVHTGTCDGEHSVYWFKNQEDEESHPGVIYTHGGRNDQCERKPDTQTHTCIYNLPMKSLNLSHAGTYYCAVVSCGRILFGDGTKLNFQDDANLLFLVHFWRAASAFATTLSVSLAILVGVMSSRRDSREASLKKTAKDSKNADTLCYVAASEVNRSRRQRQRESDDTWSECVYFSVKL